MKWNASSLKLVLRSHRTH